MINVVCDWGKPVWQQISQEIGRWFVDGMSDRTDVVYNPHAIGGAKNIYLKVILGEKLPYGGVCYNLDWPWFVERWAPAVNKIGTTIWDFDQYNTQIWKKHGVNALHVPLGYTKSMEVTNRSDEIDVVFIGRWGQHRKKRYAELASLGIDFRWETDGFVGESKRNLLARSKIAIIVHNTSKPGSYRGNPDHLRLVQYMAARCCVISEPPSDPIYKGVIFTEDIAGEIKRLLADDQSRLAAAEESYETIRATPFCPPLL